MQGFLIFGKKKPWVWIQIEIQIHPANSPDPDRIQMNLDPKNSLIKDKI